jgi:hypothetical protein
MPEETTTSTPHPQPDSDQTWPMQYTIVGVFVLLTIVVMIVAAIRSHRKVVRNKAHAQHAVQQQSEQLRHATK